MNYESDTEAQYHSFDGVKRTLRRQMNEKMGCLMSFIFERTVVHAFNRSQ